MSLQDLRDEVMNGPKKKPIDLKAKLREYLIETFALDPNSGVEAGVIEQTLDFFGQAYREAGYVSLPDRCRYCARGEDHYHGANLMTGQEFYERFEKEIDNEFHQFSKPMADIGVYYDKANVIKAAKRAAGLDV